MTDPLNSRFEEYRSPLTLAIDEPPSDQGRRLRALTRLARRSLKPDLESAERRALAHRTLNALEGLELDRAARANFVAEYLSSLRRLADDPLLCERNAQAELELVEFRIQPIGWVDGQRPIHTPLVLPALSHVGVPRPTGPLLLGAAITWCWNRSMELACDAIATGTIDTWNAEQCQAAIRTIVMAVLHGVFDDGKTRAQRQLKLFEGKCLGLWMALTERCVALGLSSEDQYWGVAGQSAVMLHLRGRVAAVDLGRSPEPPVPPGSAPAGAGARHPTRQVIVGPNPPASERIEKDILKSYEALVHPLLVALMPPAETLSLALEGMAAEFPWAVDAIQRLRTLLMPPCLLGVQELAMRPVLLVGPPGSGKSRLARRIAECFGLPYLALSLGGSHDPKILLGTARGWASAQPSPILAFMAQRNTASALVLLDEVDKTHSWSRDGPPMLSILLGLLEPETARRWQDAYLQVPCDLSGLSFWGTANSLAAIPKALLSRFEIVYVPSPRLEDLPALAAGVTHDLAMQWNLPAGVLPTVPASVWRSKASAREVRQLVHDYIASWCQETLAPSKRH